MYGLMLFHVFYTRATLEDYIRLKERRKRLSNRAKSVLYASALELAYMLVLLKHAINDRLEEVVEDYLSFFEDPRDGLNFVHAASDLLEDALTAMLSTAPPEEAQPLTQLILSSVVDARKFIADIEHVIMTVRGVQVEQKRTE